MVIVPTASVPPAARSDVLKQTDTRLSVLCIMNGASPSATHGASSFQFSRSRRRFRCSIVCLPVRKRRTNAALTACEITVASAAPCTSMWKTKMNSGSSSVFSTAPISTVIIPALEKPCAVMNGFKPRDSCTNTVPRL